MKQIQLITTACLIMVAVITVAQSTIKKREIAKGKFEPNYESLRQYKTPEWFEDAKFGIWAHWGPQCEPEFGDWYARNMYYQTRNGKPNDFYQYHLAHYGHPSVFGFKDIINLWHAENWHPNELMKLYKAAGAQYFVAMANHHDNFDNFDSKYQPWNSVNMGPKKDLIAGWAAAAKKEGLRFGVTVHAARAWSWYEPAKGSDSTGQYAGVPYDGLITKDQGKGKWWDGYDPQDLYAQNHPLKEKPDEAYKDKFFNRVKDLVDHYHPDLLYFDDSNMPLDDVGVAIAAHYYNANTQWNNGKLEGVLNIKRRPKAAPHSIVLDIERGVNDSIDAYHWQTDNCIGQWHYKKGLRYQSISTVVTMLIDIVSKNGNLLLNIPVRSDGTIDSAEVDFLKGMGKWMNVCGEGIYKTHPWKIYGEGPIAAINASAFNAKDDPKNPGLKLEQKKKPEYTAANIRFTTTKDGSLYVFLLGVPMGNINIKSLGLSSALVSKITSVKLVGSTEKITWKQGDESLSITKPNTFPTESAVAFKVNF